VEDGERQARRETRRRQLTRRRRALAGLSLLLAITAVVAVILAATGGRSSTPARSTAAGAAKRRAPPAHPAGRSGRVHPSTAAALGAGTGEPGTQPVPILMYHVINPPPPGAPFPGLYVPSGEFAAQMQALAGAGYRAVTLDQMWAYWRRGAGLPPGKPIVLSFDNGYQSQYTNALPVLRRLGWVGDENMQLSGLPPSQGGLSQREIEGLVTAGWELDTQGFSHADLITLDPAQLAYQVATARQTIKRRYGVPVNWFCYPSGHYNPTVVAEVKAAGYVGSTTVVPGWAGPDGDPYRLPRLRVLGGTSPEALLGEIAAVREDPAPPESYPG
jgi:peptidoglycan/xylan/chitin deacetylase (PgdA/CDA1 family)